MARTRLQIDVPSITMKRLILWAASNGEKRNTWARIKLTQICDENQDKVEAWLNKESQRLGITKEELENSILAREGFDFEQYRNELLGNLDE